MCWLRGRWKNLETNFPHHNLMIIFLFQLLNSFSFTLFTPSLYKFITTPTTRPDELKCLSENGTRFWPGLGGSDSDYALVLLSSPVTETLMTPLAGLIIHRFPFTVCITLTLGFYTTCGIVYALANSVWWVFAALGLCGTAAAFTGVTIHTYMGEMGTIMDDIRKKQGKKERKHLIYVLFSFVLNGAFLLPFSLTSIMAQFDLSPYHWPGWAHAVTTATVGILTILLFVEPRSFSQARQSCKSITSCFAGLKIEPQLQSKCRNIASYVFLCGCGFQAGMMYTVFTALVAPVLSDQFGFTVEYTSHFLLVASTAFLFSSILQLGTKVARMDNRKILCVGILLGFIGSLLYGDWQAIPSDSCLSTYNTNNTHSPDITTNGHLLSEDEGGYNNLTFDELCSREDENSSILQELVESCEGLSQREVSCFWNRQSRVTGTYCYSCLGVCLSQQRSHNIYQLSLGAVLVCLSASFLFVYSSAIVSDITSIKSQGRRISFVIGSGSLSRAVTPFWFIRSYELSGRHTYPAMSVTAGFGLLLLISLALLYRRLAPRQHNRTTLNATSKITLDSITDQEIVPVEVEQETINGLHSVLPVLYDTPL